MMHFLCVMAGKQEAEAAERLYNYHLSGKCC